MIWAALIVLVVAVLLYVCAPLFGTGDRVSGATTGVEEYRQNIAELDLQIAEEQGDKTELLAAKTALERKILAQANKVDIESQISTKAIVLPLAALFGISTFLLYNQLGSPAQTHNQSASLQDLEQLPLDQLVIRLEGKLQADPANPNGWILYARSLMTLGRYDDALTAYDSALALTNSDEKVVAERASAVKYIGQVQQSKRPNAPGPNAADIEAAAAMSAEERAAMIQSMVDGLSVRLMENPDDEAGWIRLLTSRNALGQADQAEVEIIRMKEALANKPETIQRILNAIEQDNP